MSWKTVPASAVRSGSVIWVWSVWCVADSVHAPEVTSHRYTSYMIGYS